MTSSLSRTLSEFLHPDFVSQPAGSLTDDGCRALFPLSASVVPLNNGAAGACPSNVLKQLAWCQRYIERMPSRFLNSELESAVYEATKAMAKFLNAHDDDLVLTPNATAGTNSVIFSLNWKRGDEIVITTHSYGGLRHTVDVLCERFDVCMNVAELPFPMDDEDAVVDAIMREITPRTKLVVLDHVTSPSAFVMPLARLVPLCRARGCLVLVDGAHGPGHVPVDLGGERREYGEGIYDPTFWLFRLLFRSVSLISLWSHFPLMWELWPQSCYASVSLLSVATCYFCF